MKKKVLSMALATCMVLSLMPGLSLPASATEDAYPYFVITRSSGADPSTATSYLYVYEKASEAASFTAFTGSSADSDSGSAYSTASKAMADITATVGTGSATLDFGSTGSSSDNVTGTLEYSEYDMSLGLSGTYTIKGSLDNTYDNNGTSAILLEGASAVIDGATIYNSGGFDASIIKNTGGGSLTINSGTISCTSETVNAIEIDAGSSGNTIINGGEISGGGEAINVDGGGNITISGGEITSAKSTAINCGAACAVDISGNDTVISGDTYGISMQEGSLSIDSGTVSGETGIRTQSVNSEISGGKVEGSAGNALAVMDGTAYISGGTIKSSNSLTDISSGMPGTIVLSDAGTGNAKLYISGGTITNTGSAGYVVCNYRYNDSYTSNVYLSGTPVISGPTADIWTNVAIYADDGEASPAAYTGGALTMYYGGTITAGTTAAVCDVTSGTNEGLFSLTNDGYYLDLTGTNLIISAYPKSENFDSLTYKQFYAVPSDIGDWHYTMYNIAGTELCNSDFENGTEFFWIQKSASNSQALYCNSNSDGYVQVSSNVGEFHLISFALQNADNPAYNTESIDSFKIIGYKGNSAVDGATQTVQAAYGDLVTVNLTGSSWYDIDQFRIYPMHGDDNLYSFYFYVDDLETGAPIIDTTPPTLSSYTPIDGATAVAVNTPLALTFSEDVTAVSGKNITIIKASDNSTIQTIAANDSTQVSVSGNVVTITPSSSLAYGTEYYILIDSGAFQDAFGNSYSGISNSTTWSFTIAAAASSTRTVTYNWNYTGASEPYTAQTVASGSKTTAPKMPTRSGYTFVGWYKEAACISTWNFGLDNVADDTTLYSKWAGSTYTVSGTVVNDDPTPAAVSGATVKVMQGNVQYGDTVITAASGSFTVTGIPNGTYNLVVTKGEHEVVVCITVSGSDYTYSGFITLPSGNRNSRLEVIGSGTPNIVVDKLNDVFDDSSIYTTTDSDTVTNGGTVEIKLTVQQNDSSTNKATVEAVMTSAGYTAGTVLDVDLTKTATTSGGAPAETSITATSGLITLIIPLPTELQGKANYVVYRAHDYGNGVVVDAITTTPNTNNERIEVSSDKTQLTLYVKYFSTYVIGYTESSTSKSSSGSSSSSGTISSYAINVTAGMGGSISPCGSVSVTKGKSQTYTITADKSYYISDVLVDGKSVGAVNTYTFTDITEKHTIEAVFSNATGLPYYLDNHGTKLFIGFASDVDGTMKYIAPEDKKVLFKENPKSFSDIAGHWGKAYIDFVTEREIFVGTGSNIFSPDTGMTRAMFATVIGRLYERSYGGLTANTKHTFTDVDYDAYYGDNVDWAAENNIIVGVGRGLFEPNREITRQEMASILYRFAEFLGVSGTNTEKAQLSYPDAVDISSWATEAALYCQQTGIITGRNGGNFVPEGTATRAEVAAILQKFIEATVK